MNLEQPRFVDAKPLMLAGLDRRYTMATAGEIPALWDEFGPHIGNVPHQVGSVCYGVSNHMFDGGDAFRYMAAVEVSEITGLPDDFAGLRLPAQRYAVFPHHEHVSKIKETIGKIWGDWVPNSGHEPAYLPGFFERYSEDFDPEVAVGEVEIWVPVKS